MSVQINTGDGFFEANFSGEPVRSRRDFRITVGNHAHCCGGRELGAFVYSNIPISDQDYRVLFSRFQSWLNEGDMRGENEGCNPTCGYVTATVITGKHTLYEKLFADVGFTKVAEWINPNTDNCLITYQYIFKDCAV